MKSSLSIVVPMLNEEAVIESALRALAPARAAGAEIVVVDGGSSDRSIELARPLADLVLRAPRGRGLQLNAGAAAARAELLLFLHADCRLPEGFERSIGDAIGGRELAWGRFDVRIAPPTPLLRIVGAAMNARSRLTGIATGDQAIFATRALFERAGRYPALPLMEDIAFCAAARRIALPRCLRAQVWVSGRRWQQHGIVRTMLRMWSLRLAYALGADASRLAARYRDVR